MRLHALPPAGTTIPAGIRACIATHAPADERRLARALMEERVYPELPVRPEGIARLITAVRGGDERMAA